MGNGITYELSRYICGENSYRHSAVVQDGEGREESGGMRVNQSESKAGILEESVTLQPFQKCQQ